MSWVRSPSLTPLNSNTYAYFSIIYLSEIIGISDELVKTTLVKPAKNDPEATITFNGQADTSVAAAVVKETPAKFTKPMPEKKSEHSNTPIFIVASDAQKRGTGWACIVPGIEYTRIALKLSEDIEPDKLYGATRNVVADIEVVKRFDKETNSYKTTEVIVSKWEAP